MRMSKILVAAVCVAGFVAAVAMAADKAAGCCDAKPAGCSSAKPADGCAGGVCPIQKTGAPAADAKAQVTCPIMDGGKVNKKIFTDYEGKRVYFCCAGCVKTFQKDPAKYIKDMESKGIVLEKTPDAKAAPAVK